MAKVRECLFEQALDAAPEPPTPDLATAAIRRGTRLRRNRRVLAGGVGVAVVLAAVVGLKMSTPHQPVQTAELIGPPDTEGWRCYPTGGRTVTLVLRDDATDAQREALNQTLAADRNLSGIRSESKEQAFQKFRQLWRDGPAAAATFRVTFTAEVGPLQVRDEFRDLPGVLRILPGDCDQIPLPSPEATR